MQDCIGFIGLSHLRRMASGFSVPAGGHNWAQLLIRVAERAVNEAGARQELVERVVELCKSWKAEELNQAAQLIEDVLEEKHAADPHSPVMTSLVADEVQRHRDNAALYPLDDQMILNNREDFPVMSYRIDWVQSMPFAGVLTTNYNSVTGGCAGCAPLTKRQDGSLARAYSALLRGSPLEKPVIQLHGSCLEPDTIVLTTEGYRKLLHSQPGYKEFLHSIMATKTILYFGFSFTDGKCFYHSKFTQNEFHS